MRPSRHGRTNQRCSGAWSPQSARDRAPRREGVAIVKNEAHVRYSAETYDHFTAKFLKPFDDLLAGVVLKELARRGPGAVLLDVGTGTARFLIHLARDARTPPARLVGTDLFPDMIEQARQALARESVSGIDLLVDDVHAMTLPDAFADIVISRSTIHHWSDPPRAFREIYRVLKPEGIAIVCDVRRDAPAEAVALFNRIREEAGLPPSFLEEKYTQSEVVEFCRRAGIAEQTKVYAPAGGMEALGLSVVIEKATPG